MKGARCLPPGPAQREKPLGACLWGPAGCPGKGCLAEPGCPTLCQRRESLSFTRSWAVTALGSLLTWLWALNPQPAEKRLELEAGSFRRGSPPSYPHRGPQPLPAGVSATCKLCQRSPAGAWGLSRRLPRPAWRARSVGAFPAASCCSGIKESGVQISFLAAKAPPAGPGALSPGLVQGASSASSGKVKCASWIAAAAATAVAGDQEGWRCQPASWGRGRRREEVKARLLRAWRSGGRHCGDPAPPRGPAHTPVPGMPRPPARGARGSAAAGREISRLAPRWLPPSSLVPRFPARPGLHVSSAGSQRHCLRASSASARRAPHTEPQHCLPLNSLHATWPSRRLPGSWAEPGPGLLGSSARAASSEPRFYSSGKWAAETHVRGSFGKFTATIVPNTKMLGPE